MKKRHMIQRRAIVNERHPKKRVLIIDDEIFMLNSLKRLLHFHNYACMTATSAVEGLKLASTTRPDIILLDLNMPEMSGLGFLNELRKSKDFEGIPVVILSAIENRYVSMETQDLGAVNYIVKPYKSQHLLDVLDKYAHTH